MVEFTVKNASLRHFGKPMGKIELQIDEASQNCLYYDEGKCDAPVPKKVAKKGKMCNLNNQGKCRRKTPFIPLSSFMEDVRLKIN